LFLAGVGSGTEATGIARRFRNQRAKPRPGRSEAVASGRSEFGAAFNTSGGGGGSTALTGGLSALCSSPSVTVSIGSKRALVQGDSGRGNGGALCAPAGRELPTTSSSTATKEMSGTFFLAAESGAIMH
jgi:hypothetical protein